LDTTSKVDDNDGAWLAFTKQKDRTSHRQVSMAGDTPRSAAEWCGS